MEQLLNCVVEHGVFSGEWSVTVQSADGEVSLFVDESFVELGEKPNGEATPGRLRVKVVNRGPDLVLVQLPGSSVSHTRVRVPLGMLAG